MPDTPKIDAIDAPVSPMDRLKAIYGNTKPHKVINRAIRAELAGGNEALDALTLLRKMAKRHPLTNEIGKPSAMGVAYAMVMKIVDAMDDAIRNKYGLPLPDHEGLRRAGKVRSANALKTDKKEH